MRLAAFALGFSLVCVCAAEHPPPSVGANKFDLMTQYQGKASGGDGSARYRRITIAMARKSLDDARDVGINFLRVAIAGYHPAAEGRAGDLDLWRESPALFWRRMDALMDDLDARAIGLVPVFVWNPTQFPFMAGETVSDLVRDPDSASWRLLERYVSDFIGRYRNRKTVLFYELTNELNLSADLDQVSRCRKAREAKACAAAGNFSTEDMIGFAGRFVRLVRNLDPKRPVSSGFSVPRPAAEHLRARPEWSHGGPDWRPDTRAQLARNLRDIHRPVDIISVHLYDSPQNRRFGAKDAVALVEQLHVAAQDAGKPLFVGEFGDPNPGSAGPDSFSSRLISRMVQLQVPYSAVWVWQFYQFNLREPPKGRESSFSLEPGATDYLLERISDANRRFGRSPSEMKADKDASPPRVVLAWPIDCQLVRVADKLHALASDDRRVVSRVEFWIDGVRSSTDRNPPYEEVLGAERLGRGEHVVTAKAFDAAGNEATWSNRIFVNDSGRSRECARAMDNRN